MDQITRKQLIHAGKANNVYTANSPDYLELDASDRISAGNGAKKDVVANKGIANNMISSAIFRYLEDNGIPTHYVGEKSNQASKLVKSAEMIPLEVICKFETAGSFCKRYGCKAGIEFDIPFVEFTFKHDNPDDPASSDPPIDRRTIPLLPEITLIEDEREVALIEYYTARVGELLSDF